MKCENMSDDELYEMLSNCKSKTDAQKKLGIIGVSGTVALDYLADICNSVGFDVNELDINYKRRAERKRYNENPNCCLNCGSPIPFEDRLVKKFCNSSCAAEYNNKKRGKRSEETKRKISESLKNIERRCQFPPVNTREVHMNDGTIQNLFSYEASALFYDGKISFEEIKNIFPNIVKSCAICGNEFIMKTKSNGHLSQSTTCSSECLKELKIKRGKETYEKVKSEGRFQGWKSRNIKSYAEKFWERVLNNNQIEFEREYYVKPYFLDFMISVNGVILDLEIDGKQHEYEDRKESDAVRDSFLKECGVVVYRVKWNEISSEEGSLMMKNKIDNFLSFYRNLAG